MFKLSGTWALAACIWFNSGRVGEFFSNLQLWQLVTLQPLTYSNLQYLFGKDLDIVVNIISLQETASILKIGFDLSKWPHLHRAYVIRDCIFFATTVYNLPAQDPYSSGKFLEQIKGKMNVLKASKMLQINLNKSFIAYKIPNTRKIEPQLSIIASILFLFDICTSVNYFISSFETDN